MHTPSKLSDLRDALAITALPVLVEKNLQPDDAATKAYAYAEAMLRERYRFYLEDGKRLARRKETFQPTVGGAIAEAQATLTP